MSVGVLFFSRQAPPEQAISRWQVSVYWGRLLERSLLEKFGKSPVGGSTHSVCSQGAFLGAATATAVMLGYVFDVTYVYQARTTRLFWTMAGRQLARPTIDEAHQKW